MFGAKRKLFKEMEAAHKDASSKLRYMAQFILIMSINMRLANELKSKYYLEECKKLDKHYDKLDDDSELAMERYRFLRDMYRAFYY